MLTLGIDIGTSGVRSAVLQGDRVVSDAKSAHLPQNPNRIDATAWWQAVTHCLHTQITALKAAGFDPQDISGIAVDGTSGSMVLTDAALTPVSPALMYNSKGFDAEAIKIATTVQGDHIVKGSNSALARAMRLVSMANQSPVYLLHQADFIAAKLMGQGGMSDYNNALKTGFDPETGHWPDGMADLIDPALLPQVHSPGTPLGQLSTDMAKTFGMSTSTQIHAGTTDSIAAFLAAAPQENGVAVTSLGSTLAVKLLSPYRIDDPVIGLYAHRVGDLWLIGGASNTGGAVLKSYFDDQTLRKLSAQIDPMTKTSLDYYPLLEPGERFPINDPSLPPRLTPRPDDDVAFLHGMLDGIARIEARCYQEIAARGASKPTTILTAGGGAQNITWQAIRARHLGITPQIANHTDAAIGAARLAQQG